MPTNKFKPLKARFRATFSGNQLGAARLGEIDEEQEVLHDVQITLEGEAKGHGVWLDREFCESVAAAGNATGDVGLKVRYGHPAMCADAIGTELGRAKNFRVVDIERDIDGEKVNAAGVVADVHILTAAHSAPQGDIAKHVLETAKEDPSQFGQSIVFTYADWVVKDKDGARHSYREEVMGVDAEGKVVVGEDGKPRDLISDEAWEAQSADGKVYAVLGRLHGSDFTDTPAATDGIFSTNTLAEEAVEMLDEHPEIFDAIEKSPKSIVEFLERTGLGEKIESARLSGLQAAKDKEIGALKEALAAKDAEIAMLTDKVEASANAGEDALAAKDAEIKQLKSDIDEKTKALDAAKSAVEQLESKHAETEKALAETQAALKVETERYRDQVGIALQQPGSASAHLHGRDLVASSVKIS